MEWNIHLYLIQNFTIFRMIPFLYASTHRGMLVSKIFTELANLGKKIIKKDIKEKKYISTRTKICEWNFGEFAGARISFP